MNVVENDPELNGKYLGTISKDFVKISDNIKEASYQIRSRGYSEYPIFPISKTGISIGQIFLSKSDVDLEWNYYASFLEEFVQLKLIKEDKVEDFKNIYKNPDEYCCLFVIDNDFTNFLFIPFPND